MKDSRDSLKRAYSVLPRPLQQLALKILGFQGNTVPSSDFLRYCHQIIDASASGVRIAELGVDRGATARKILDILREGDVFDLFDRDSAPFFRDRILVQETYASTINFYGNSNKDCDSYAWSLAKLCQDLANAEIEMQIWDLIYLDGAHTYLVDGAATAYLKEMLKVGGIIVFDDVNWTMAASPTCSTALNRKRYTQDQMSSPHVSLIIDTLVKPDPRFVLVSENKARAAYQKIL